MRRSGIQTAPVSWGVRFQDQGIFSVPEGAVNAVVKMVALFTILCYIYKA